MHCRRLGSLQRAAVIEWRGHFKISGKLKLTMTFLHFHSFRNSETLEKNHRSKKDWDSLAVESLPAMYGGSVSSGGDKTNQIGKL